VLLEPWLAAGARGYEDLERSERSRVTECVPAGVDNGLDTFPHRTDRYFYIVDRITQEVVAVVDHSHEHGVAIAKVILDDPPGHSCSFGDMAGGCRREAFFSHTSDRFVNYELAGTVPSDLTLDRSSRGSAPSGRTHIKGRHRISPRTWDTGRSRSETSPGGAAHTAGIALTAFMAVAITPASLWSVPPRPT